jgi:ABC-type transport system involved in multi-copper enzyme maturation permease subunit
MLPFISSGAFIIESDPENNAENVTVYISIKLVFNTTMNKTSIKENLNISPVLKNGYQLFWNNGDRELTIKSNSPLEYSQNYIISLNNSTDASENRLENSSLYFKTEKKITKIREETINSSSRSLYLIIIILILMIIIGFLLGYIYFSKKDK